MKDIDKELDELIYEVYRQSRLKEQDLEHKPYDQVKTQAVQAIKQLINQARIEENKIFLKFAIDKPSDSLVRVDELAQRANSRIKEL